MYKSPFEGLTNKEIYDSLMKGDNALPRWPDEKIQRGYSGLHGPQVLQRAFDFIAILEKDGAFVENWKGLDYGCGWGRFASTLLSKGGPDQLDLCDAWKHTLAIISNLNYKNKLIHVSEMLKEGELSSGYYDFILSFSVFTHLAAEPFHNNIKELLKLLKPGGRLYITVRHEEFFDHAYKESAAEERQKLEQDGIWFTPPPNSVAEVALFGTTVVTPEFMKTLGGQATYLGLPHSLQHVWRLEP